MGWLSWEPKIASQTIADMKAEQLKVWKKQYIADNTTDVEVSKSDAFETVQVEAQKLYDVTTMVDEEYEIEEVVLDEDGQLVMEIIDVDAVATEVAKTRKITKVRQVANITQEPKQVGEDVSYKLEGDEVIEVKTPVWETGLVDKIQLHKDCRFDEKTGKFYKTVNPTDAEVNQAVAQQFKAKIPTWMEKVN